MDGPVRGRPPVRQARHGVPDLADGPAADRVPRAWLQQAADAHASVLDGVGVIVVLEPDMAR